MNIGIQVVWEVGNMVDFDFDFIKFIEVVEIGKQLLIMWGVLMMFLIVNDVVKYFVIIFVMFVGLYLVFDKLNVMVLYLLRLVILLVVIFNVLVIVVLILLVLWGVWFRVESVLVMLWCNLLIYGLGGFVVLFIGIKLVDFVIVVFGVF